MSSSDRSSRVTRGVAVNGSGKLQETQCYKLHNAHTCDHIHWAPRALSQVGCRVFLFTRTRTCTLAQVWVFHVTSMCMVIRSFSSPWSSLSTSCSTFRPCFLFFNYMKSVVNLHNSCNESMDSTDEFSLSTGYEPKAHDFYETSVEPNVQLLNSSPLFSGPRLRWRYTRRHAIKYIESKPITLYEKTCLSVCRRRQCPIEQVDLLEIDRGDPVSTEAQKHRLGLCSMIQKSKFLQNAKQDLVNTNFKQLGPKKSNESSKDN